MLAVEDIVSDWRDQSKVIEECKYISVEKIEPLAPWGVRVTVEEVVPGFGPDDPERDYVPELAARIRAEMSLRQQVIARIFEIEFPEAISYHVTNESYGKYPEPPEVFTGKHFRLFETSLLLDWVRKTSYASDDHPGPLSLMHFEIVGQDDVVDVITTREPLIRVVSGRRE